MKICELTRSERERVEAEANFSIDQKRLFDLMSADCTNNEGMILATQMSRRRFYIIKKQVIDKVEKILDVTIR